MLCRQFRFRPSSRRLEPYTTGEPLDLPPRGSLPVFNRVAYAAAHVVADPLADIDPWLDAAIDWERTIAFRHYLWDLGLGVAEAMDTAQRGMGLDWVRRQRTDSAARSKQRRRGPARLSVAASAPTISSASDDVTLDDVIHAYEEQIEAIETYGRQAHPHGEPRTCSGCQATRGIRQGLRSHPDAGATAGHPALARRDVRSQL